MKILKSSVVALALFSAAIGTTAPATAQPVAGGIVAVHQEIDIGIVANGWSVMKVLRGGVYNSGNDFVGYVHDAIVLPDGSTSFVVVNVAGFLNVGSKLIALPVEAFGIRKDGNLVLPNATKDNLKALPKFIYN